MGGSGETRERPRRLAAVTGKVHQQDRGAALRGIVQAVDAMVRRCRDLRLLRERAAVQAGGTRLLLFSGAGFTNELQKIAGDPTVELVGLERLYHGT